MIERAVSGDTLYLRGQLKYPYAPEVCQLIASAARRGVEVKIFASTTGHPEWIDNLRNNIAMVIQGTEQEQGIVLSRINVLVSSQDSHFKQAMAERGWPGDVGEEGLLKDHAKLYGVLRASGDATVITGSYNLDNQSVQRSHENVVVIDDGGRYLHDNLIKFYDASSARVINFAKS